MKKISGIFFLSIALLIFMSSFDRDHYNRQGSCEISITQLSLMSMIYYSYHVSDSRITVTENVYDKNGLSSSKVYRTRIPSNVWMEIQDYTKVLSTLDTAYRSAALDGFIFEIDINCADETKHIVVENTGVGEIDTLFAILNRAIKPTRYWLIKSQ